MVRAAPNTSLEEHGRPTRENAPFVTWRLGILGLAAFAILTVFGVRIYYLTILRGPYFYELSEHNFIFERPISGPRGKIMTGDGTTVAFNRTLYDIEMSPFGLKPDQISRAIDRLADLMGRPELRKKAEAVVKLRPKWKSLALARDLDLHAIGPVLERAYELPGVVIEPRYSREYPYGSLLAHVTGYVGAIAPNQMDGYLEKGYLREDKIGKMGAERQFESSLRGVHGKEIYIRDAQGRPRSNWVEDASTRGNDVVLTIDLELQAKADALMADQNGVIVVMDPRDGAILALISKPDYDSNEPTRGIANGERSTYNKAFRSAYSPGSTFKVVTASAGLLAGFDPDEKGYCDGSYSLANLKWPFYCDVRSGHEWLDLYGAIQKSCNVFFYRWADRIGRQKMTETALAFGFGRPTGIDLALEGYETSGVLGRPESETVFQGSVVQMGIGQGALISATPMQLVAAYSALGNGGKRYRPHVFKEERKPTGQVVRRCEPQLLDQLPINEDQRRILLEGFRRVAQVKEGTAFSAGFKPEWNVAGKTGSAEVAQQKSTNGWFVAFAPLDAPTICLVVLIEKGGHGGAVSAPIARDLFEAYFARNFPKTLASANASDKN